MQREKTLNHMMRQQHKAHADMMHQDLEDERAGREEAYELAMRRVQDLEDERAGREEAYELAMRRVQDLEDERTGLGWMRRR